MSPATVGELRHLASQFEEPWPYLQLIATGNGIADALDHRVVEAYWVGNELTAAVPARSLAGSLDDRFGRRASDRAALVSTAAAGVPQHSFHVFAAHPWLGMLRAGMEGPPLEVLDRCRIRWGRVVAVLGDLVLVRSRRLTFTGSRLVLGPDRVEEARRNLDGTGFTRLLEPGDLVTGRDGTFGPIGEACRGVSLRAGLRDGRGSRKAERLR